MLIKNNIMRKFTQEVKDNWLNALKSGNYKQGYGSLEGKINNEVRHCCIGVLGDIHPELSNYGSEACPYKFLEETVGEASVNNLWERNDDYGIKRFGRPEDYKDDYSNVIPLIEALPVQEDNKKELILKAYSEGKIIQSNHSGDWSDFVPQNQVDKPNLDYGTIDNWRIKP